ncbi:MAG: Z1 domain-containing protein, partial [Nitrospiraceae bacterium]
MAMMTNKTLAKLMTKATIKDQYKKQLARVRATNFETKCIEPTVDGVLTKLPKASTGSLVVYGDPQSGKTEMMICLTAKLLDAGHQTIVHLMNDSVDLLRQNLDRFKLAGLAPAPRNASDLANSPLVAGHHAILFCKKNAQDLTKLIQQLQKAGPVVVIDDEADYATPNAKINTQEKTRINELVSTLLGNNGNYIGVTATPARLNLNNTFNNKTETWVHFP